MAQEPNIKKMKMPIFWKFFPLVALNTLRLVSSTELLYAWAMIPPMLAKMSGWLILSMMEGTRTREEEEDPSRPRLDPALGAGPPLDPGGKRYSLMTLAFSLTSRPLLSNFQ